MQKTIMKAPTLAYSNTARSQGTFCALAGVLVYPGRLCSSECAEKHGWKCDDTPEVIDILECVSTSEEHLGRFYEIEFPRKLLRVRLYCSWEPDRLRYVYRDSYVIKGSKLFFKMNDDVFGRHKHVLVHFTYETFADRVRKHARSSDH